MRWRLIAVLAFARAFTAMNLTLAEQLLTFDEIKVAGTAATLSNGYGGLRWTNFFVVNGVLNTAYSKGVVSANNVAYTGLNGTAMIYSGHPFDLNSAWVTLTPGGDSVGRFTVVTLYGTTRILTNNYVLVTNIPVHMQFDLQNVTGVQITGAGIMLDNVSVTVTQPQLLSLPGWFKAGSLYYLTSEAWTLGAGDLNGDGLGDLIVGGRTGSAIGVGLPNGTLRMLTNGISANFVEVADVTLDGRDDAIMVNIVNSFSGSTRLIQFTNLFAYSTNGFTNGLPAIGTAAFADFGGTNRLLRVPNTTDIAVADFNGDRKLDYVALNIPDFAGDSTFVVSTNRGDGVFTTTWFETSAIQISHGHSSVVARDFDGDGDVDFATANEKSGTVGIFLNNRRASFTTMRLYDVGIARPVAVAAGDLDGDGIEDLAVRSVFSGLSILRGLGLGRFAEPLVISHGDATPSTVKAARTLVIHDLNGDGAPDIAFIDGLEVATLLNIFPPRVHIARIEDLVEVYWPTNFARGAVLESSATLGPNAVWTPVTFPPIDAVGSRIVFDSGEDRQLFYRLRRPQ